MIQRQNKAKGESGLVFISHVQADKELARGIAKELKRAHFEPWLAEESLAPGDNWAKSLGNAMEASDSIVVLISRQSLQSPAAQHEWFFAISSAKHAGRVIPVLTPGTRMESVPWILKHIQHVRSSTDLKRTAKAVVTALRKLPETG